MKVLAIAIVALIVGLGPRVAVAAPLTIVTHDPTLAGNGTTASPLRVVSPYNGVTHDGTLTGNGTPTSPLSVVSPYTGVTHDGTLSGNGTPASPLRVVSPYTGVTHDGTLTGSGTLASPLSVAAPAGGSLTVFDANGALVGKYDGGAILRKLGDTWVNLSYGPVHGLDDVNGLVANGFALRLVYETSDCTGAGYMQADQGLLKFSSSPRSPHTTVFFPVGPILTITMRSLSEESDSGRICNPQPSLTQAAQAPASFDLTTLGLVLPFRVE